MSDPRYHHHDEAEVEGELGNPYVPMALGPSIPNYYGDYVRRLFFLCAAMTLILSPFLTSAMPALLPFEIGGALIFAVLGALTSPTNKVSMLSNILAAGVGVLGYELLALSAYAEQLYLAFIEREIIALALLGALYFSVKSLRNMESGRVGKRDTIRDFVRPGDRRMMFPGDGD